MIRSFLAKAAKAFWYLPALLLWAAFPPVGEKTDVFFALAPLLWYSRNRTPKQSFAKWFLNGFIFWIATLSWMPAIIKNGGPWPLVVLGWGVLSAYCALYFGAFGFLSARFWTFAKGRSYAWRAWGLLAVEPFLWAGLELVRSRLCGGFAWNQLGVAPVNASLGAPAVFGGVFLASAVVVLVNGTIASIAERMIARETGAMRWARSLETVVPFALVWWLYSASGAEVERQMSYASEDAVSAGLFQRNFPCAFSGEPENAVAIYDSLAATVAQYGPDVAILPESALAEFGPADGLRAAAFMRFLKEKSGAKAVLAGGSRSDLAAGKLYNSAVLYTGGAEPLRIYDKVHLVPFGEYIPFDKKFPALQKLAPVGSCHPGKVALLEYGKTRFGSAICFEDTDSTLSADFARMGANALVFITNDSWFGGSIEPVQHAWQSVARAIETGLPVFRAGNSGVTGTIDPSGEATWLAGKDGRPLVDARGAMCAALRPRKDGAPPTPYVAFGDWPIWIAFIAALAFPLPFRPRRRPADLQAGRILESGSAIVVE